MTGVVFVSGDVTLSGNLFQAPTPASGLAFLFIQGWLGHQNIQAADAVASLGYTALTYDMRGNGASSGDITTTGRREFLADAVVAYDYLLRTVPANTRIGVIGSSFGSYTAALLSSERPVHCLSLRVPANYPDDDFDKPIHPSVGSQILLDWRNHPLDFTTNKALRAVHDFPGAIQIIKAEADEQVSSQTVENYVTAVSDTSKLTYQVMADAPHSLSTQQLQDEYKQLLTAWTFSL